jgi:hypothetical protein
MSEWNRVQADERLEARTEHRPLRHLAADGVGPIQHDERDCGFGAGLHGERHRPHEGVHTNAHVLQIEDERVETGEHLGRRLAHFAVERMHGTAGHGVRVVIRLDHVVLLFAPGSVLGTEERVDAKSRLQEHIRAEPEIRRHGRRMK